MRGRATALVEAEGSIEMIYYSVMIHSRLFGVFVLDHRNHYYPVVK